MIKAKGSAILVCESTGQTFEIEADDLDWQDGGDDERGMGTEFLYKAEVEFEASDGQKAFCEWTASEYPEGVLNGVTSYTRNANLTKEFLFSWVNQPDDED